MALLNKKKLEVYFKNKLNHFFYSKHNPVLIDKTDSFIDINNCKRILLLRHDRMGDILISSPFLGKLRHLAPDAKIDAVLSYKNYPAVRAIENYIDRFFVLSNNILKSAYLLYKLRREHYNLIIDMLDNESVNSNLILKVCKSDITLGFNKSNRCNYFFVVKMPDKSSVHPASRLFSLLMAFGYTENSTNIRLEFPLTETEKQTAIRYLGAKSKTFRFGINLSGSSLDKYWGDENYIKFINMVKAEYPEIEILLFSTRELQKNAEIISINTKSKIAPVQRNFNVYAAMLSECDLILTPDTSAVHLSSSLGIPVLALYKYPEKGEDMPWLPLNVLNRTIIDRHSMNQIKVIDVYRNFKDLLNEID